MHCALAWPLRPVVKHQAFSRFAAGRNGDGSAHKREPKNIVAPDLIRGPAAFLLRGPTQGTQTKKSGVPDQVRDDENRLCSRSKSGHQSAKERSAC